MFGRLLFYLFLIKFAIGDANIPSTTTKSGTTVPITVGSVSTTGVSKSTTTKITHPTTKPTEPTKKPENRPQTTTPEAEGVEDVRSGPTASSGDNSPMIIGIVVASIFFLLILCCSAFGIYRCITKGPQAGSPFGATFRIV